MRHTISSILVLSVIGLAPSPARAEDSTFRQDVRQRSTRSVADRSIRLWSRRPGPGRAQTVAALLQRFQPAGANARSGAVPARREAADHTLVSGADWLLDVRGEGDWVRYHRHGYIDRARPLRAQERLSFSDIEARARRILAQDLAGLVPLGEGEELVAWYSGHQGAVQGGARQEAVKDVRAMHVVFTRRIDGLPVLGAGSKVRVVIAADGTFAGVDLDWPRLQDSGRRIRGANPGEIARRRHLMRADAAGAAALANDSLECGYYDAGVLEGGSPVLQPGCISAERVANASRDTATAGVLQVFPAGVTFQPDPSLARAASRLGLAR